jgi:hypothetical protein
MLDDRDIDRGLGARIGRDPLLLLSLVLDLYDPVPIVRSDAAASVRRTAVDLPASVLPYAGDVASALGCPERRTRWEALQALQALASHDARELVRLGEDVANTLYDSDSPAQRRLALAVLETLSRCSARAAALLWPLFDEALAFFRGEPEYPLVLASAVVFVEWGVECDVEALLDLATADALDRRARVRVLAFRLRGLLREG